MSNGRLNSTETALQLLETVTIEQGVTIDDLSEGDYRLEFLDRAQNVLGSLDLWTGLNELNNGTFTFDTDLSKMRAYRVIAGEE